MRKITLYSKPGCHLCDHAKDLIQRVAATHPLELEVRNIESDPGDFVRYRYDIPVVLLDGIEVARHRLSEVRLVYLLTQPPENGVSKG